jgi:hypothetical protein
MILGLCQHAPTFVVNELNDIIRAKKSLVDRQVRLQNCNCNDSNHFNVLEDTTTTTTTTASSRNVEMANHLISS